MLCYLTSLGENSPAMEGTVLRLHGSAARFDLQTINGTGLGVQAAGRASKYVFCLET